MSQQHREIGARLALVFGPVRARAIVTAWMRVLADEPLLMAHLVALGCMMDPGIDATTGQPISADLHQYRAGRRDLVLELMACAEMDFTDLRVAMREVGYEPDDDALV